MNTHSFIIIIIISCYPLWASTKRRQLVLSLAILFTSQHLFPFSNASLWTDLRHVCLGLPLLLFPCGFQSKTSLSMASFPFLSACPHTLMVLCYSGNQYPNSNPLQFYYIAYGRCFILLTGTLKFRFKTTRSVTSSFYTVCSKRQPLENFFKS
jgi:hypothetical protein